MKEPRPSSRSSAYRGKKRPRDDVITVSKCRCGRAPGTAESLQLAEEQGREQSRGDPNRQSGTGFELGRVVNRGNRPNQRRRVPRVPSPAAAARWGSGTAAPLDVPPGPGLPGVTLAVPAPCRRHRSGFGRCQKPPRGLEGEQVPAAKRSRRHLHLRQTARPNTAGSSRGAAGARARLAHACPGARTRVPAVTWQAHALSPAGAAGSRTLANGTACPGQAGAQAGMCRPKNTRTKTTT